MTINEQWAAYTAIFMKEWRRNVRIWRQTLFPPVINSALFLFVFGYVMGHRLGAIDGHHYIFFITPGLIAMSVINSAYSGAVSAFFVEKFQGSVQELLVSPTPPLIILLGYISGALVRALIVGVVVAVVSFFFFSWSEVYSIWLMLLIIVLASLLFAVAGVINAVFARTFDEISLIPAFVLTPLTFLGGVFYSIDMLPPFWHRVALFNPFFYIVDDIRYAFIGRSDTSFSLGLLIIFSFLVIGFIVAWSLIKARCRLVE